MTGLGRAIVDMDLVVYRVGFACDNMYYEFQGERYESKASLEKLLKGNGVEDIEPLIEKRKEPETWEDTRDSVNEFIEDLVQGYDDYIGFISGKGNFRYRCATILPYKGKRDSEKPTHYDEIRQFLVEKHGAQMSVNMEADDAIGLAYQEGDTIVSLDKDLDIIPGIHYNWERDLLYTVNDMEGYKNFFKQMLTGDSTDNILGLYGVGPKSKLLKRIDDMVTIDEMRDYVLEQYTARFGNYGPAFFVENAKLLWILHNRPNPIVQGEYWRDECQGGTEMLKEEEFVGGWM